MGQVTNHYLNQRLPSLLTHISITGSSELNHIQKGIMENTLYISYKHLINLLPFHVTGVISTVELVHNYIYLIEWRIYVSVK